MKICFNPSLLSFGPSNFCQNENHISLVENNNLEDSYNFIRESLQNNNNSPNLNENQIEQFEKLIKDYEKNISKVQNQIQTHFDFSGDINKYSLNDINNEKENRDDFLNNFLSDEEIKKKCRLYSNYNYITFENKYKENSCYINVILHFLYRPKNIRDYLIYLYQLEERNADKNAEQKDEDEKEKDNKEKMQFLILLGKIFYQYNKGLDNKKHKIIRLRTFEFRQKLNEISKGKFLMNYVADPLDFLDYVLEILNEKIKEDVKVNFFLEICEEYDCQKCKKVIKKNYYDKDNFIHHIYVQEYFNYLNDNKLTEKNYKNKFFLFSQFISLKNDKKCQKCQKNIIKKIKCKTDPNYLIINCIWSNPVPEIWDVIKFYHLLSLKEDLKNLFQFQKLKENHNLNYYLSSIILYSSSLYHYITAIFNPKQKMFCLYDDNYIIEFKSVIELIESITANLLRINDNYFYYPVLLIYEKNDIYDAVFLKDNQLNEKSYEYLINKCNLSIKQYRDNKEKQEKIKKNKNNLEKQTDIPENKDSNINNNCKINKINNNLGDNNNININKKEKKIIHNNINNNKNFNNNNKNSSYNDNINNKINNPFNSELEKNKNDTNNIINENLKNMQKNNNKSNDFFFNVIFENQNFDKCNNPIPEENTNISNQISSNDSIGIDNNKNKLIDSYLIDDKQIQNDINISNNKKDFGNKDFIGINNLKHNQSGTNNQLINEDEKNNNETSTNSFSFSKSQISISNNFNLVDNNTNTKIINTNNNKSQGNPINLLDLNIHFDYDYNMHDNKNLAHHSKQEEAKINNNIFEDINLKPIETNLEKKKTDDKIEKNIITNLNEDNKNNPQNNEIINQKQQNNIQNIIDDLV